MKTSLTLKFIDEANTTIANPNVFKRRILGLTSYFRSAQESLLPRFEMKGDKTFHIVQKGGNERAPVGTNGG
jgi:hypothetical protein